MKKVCTAVLAIGMTLLCSCSIRQIEHKAHTITVSGTGQVEAKNDQALISLKIESRGQDILAATKANDSELAKVKEALVTFGIPESNLISSDYEITHEESAGARNSRIKTYTVNTNLTVVLKDLSRTGEVISTALENGAEELSSLTYSASVKTQENAIKQARLLAIKQAEENASLLATSSGASLGTVVNITELYGSTPRSELSRENPMSFKKGSRSDADTLMTITVNATYELK